MGSFSDQSWAEVLRLVFYVLYTERMNLILKILVRPEIFVYIALGFFAAVFFALSAMNSGAVSSGGELASHYWRNISEARILWTLVLFCVALFAHGVVLWAKAMISGADPAAVFSFSRLKTLFPRLRSFVKNILLVGVPSALAFYGTSSALAQMNIFNAGRLRDELLFRWDVLLTGTFPPFTAASLHYPGWFVQAVETSFFYLVPILTIFGAYLLIANQQLFRQAVGAFFLGLMVLYMGWLVFPVLSPHDRFVDNVYELPAVEAVGPYLANYQPQKEIGAFLANMRENKEELSVLPTSTFPSAHVAWATLLVYYAWRLWRPLVIAALPFAALSSIGTFLFAQHYFVDFPAGILVSASAIYVVWWLARKQQKLGKQASVSTAI